MNSIIYDTFTITFGIIMVYGYIYSTLGPDDFDFKTPIDPYYFSMTTMSTVGYGDILPKSQRAKIIVMTQQMALLAEIATLINKIMKV
tara:strand:+ start:182 stop:445 length:264 start_codon:yes stop_codon:yes gene_type:complete